MNRLDLVNSAIVECGVSGGPVATAVQTTLSGSIARIGGWVDQAWNEIQTMHDDWDWMRSSILLGAGASFATLAGQASYPLGTGAGTVGVLAANFGKWDRRTFRCYTTTVGYTNEQFLDDIPFDVWRDSYMFGAMRTVQTRPVAVAIGPDRSVNLGPPSNGLYTINGDYFVAPSIMVDDDDDPTGLDARFQMLIVYKAMLKYAGYESAPEVESRAKRDFKPLMTQLEDTRLPEMSFAGALS